MNLDEIRAMGIVEARKLKLEDVLKGVFEGQTYIVWIAREQDKNGNWLRWAWEVRNCYDGNLVSRHRIQWTYHDPKVGNVDEIKAEEFYDDDSPKSLLVTRQDEKGEKQPVIVKRQSFAKPIAEPTGELERG